jgi:hypothetical protein
LKKTSSEVLDYYDERMTNLVAQKYGIEHLEALRRFLSSETYAMLLDAEFEMWDFGPPAILDIWECEQITGDPRNSLYIRGY